MQRKIDMYESGAYADYVQSRARRDLNLANPDETVLLVRWGVRPTAPEGDQASAASADERPNWKRWIDAFSGH
jgi:hypothetical protein